MTMVVPQKANYFVAANDRLPKSMYRQPGQPVIQARDMQPRHGSHNYSHSHSDPIITDGCSNSADSDLLFIGRLSPDSF